MASSIVSTDRLSDEALVAELDKFGETTKLPIKLNRREILRKKLNHFRARATQQEKLTKATIPKRPRVKIRLDQEDNFQKSDADIENEKQSNSTLSTDGEAIDVASITKTKSTKRTLDSSNISVKQRMSNEKTGVIIGPTDCDTDGIRNQIYKVPLELPNIEMTGVEMKPLELPVSPSLSQNSKAGFVKSLFAHIVEPPKNPLTYSVAGSISNHQVQNTMSDVNILKITQTRNETTAEQITDSAMSKENTPLNKPRTHNNIYPDISNMVPFE